MNHCRSPAFVSNTPVRSAGAPISPLAPTHSVLKLADVPDKWLTTLYASSNLPEELPLVPFAVIASIILLIIAQSWINFLLKGDQGLGAFLSDGSGYNKSGFKPKKDKDTVGVEDPLPWLKLPEFDYVDVAGQPKRPQISSETQTTMAIDGEVISKMEALKDEMKIKVSQGDFERAKKIEMQLETLMKKEGYTFLRSFE